MCYNIGDMKRTIRIALPILIMALPLVAAAQIKFLPPCATTSDPALAGNCGITDILAVFINVAEFLLGITGAVALGFFVYGGFTFVLSRGNKAQVDKAFTILRNAVVGIAIIFTAGVIVRFTTQALTGGSSAIPTIGETCNSSTKKSDPNGDGLWVSIPAGYTDPGHPDETRVAEGLVCIKKETTATSVGAPCSNLNAVLEERNRLERFSCKSIGESSNCVRGLCSKLGADIACCH